MYRLLDTMTENVARAMALAGGLVLILVVVLTCVSIVGRSMIWAGLGPIPGDFELVEAGIGFAVFSFLPWCHYQRANARVDLFEKSLGRAANVAIEIASNILMMAIAFLIAWRLWLGMLDKKGYTETTFILQFPVWIAYAAGLIGAVVFAAVSLFCVIRAIHDGAAPSHD